MVPVSTGQRGFLMWDFPDCPGQIWTRWDLRARLRRAPPTFPGLDTPPHCSSSKTCHPSEQDMGSWIHFIDRKTEAQINKLPSLDLGNTG